MATLFDKQIDLTYQGLIKTADNEALGAVEKEITDGEGTSSTLKLGTTSASFVGNLDLTGATITGLPVDPNTTYELSTVQFGSAAIIELKGSDLSNSTIPLFAGSNITLTSNGTNITIAAGGGAAGLVAGTGTGSMESDASLTTTAADAQGANSIALGDSTVAYADGSILIGNSVNDADASREKVVSIGNDLGSAQRTVNIGNSQNAYGGDGVCIGGSNSFGENYNVVVGYGNSVGVYPNQVIIGTGSTGQFQDSVVIGNTSASGASGAVALGSGITAAVADTVSVKALETQTNSTPTAGGIIMSDAGGTDRRINIDAAGGLQIDSTPVGGGGGGAVGASTTTATTHAGADTSDVNLVSFAVPANTFTAGDIIRMDALNTMDFTGGGTIYQGVWLSNSTTPISGVQIGGTEGTVNQSQFYSKTGFIVTADGTGAGTAFHGADQNSADQNANGTAQYSDRSVSAVDWTSIVYVNFNTFVDNAGSSITNHGVNIVKIN